MASMHGGNVSAAAAAWQTSAVHIVLGGPGQFDYALARLWVAQRRPFCLAVMCVYLVSLFALKKWMEGRPKGFDLQVPLVVWNTCLDAFSFVGAYYTVGEYAHIFTTYGFDDTWCRVHDFFHGTTGYWIYLFTISKIFELGDSYFLVLRKRPIVFLQYYHHTLTLFYTWYSYSDEPSYNRIGSVMNYSVHAAMYLYFLLRSLRVRVPSLVARLVTTMQIMQFMVSLSLLLYGYYNIVLHGAQCDWPITMFRLAVVMNFSYFVLFAHFFYRSYIKREHSTYGKKAD